MKRKWVKAYVGVGSNLGDRKKNIEKALSFLKARKEIKILRISSLYDTVAVGGRSQANYLNAVFCFKTFLDPRRLLAVLQGIEKKMGRPLKREKWCPRVIDLDILFYSSTIFEKNKLIIPHPLMHERFFVLRPLLELAPRAVHPILKKTVKKLFNELKKNEKTLSFGKR